MQDVPVPQQAPATMTVPLDLVGGGSFRFPGARLDAGLAWAIIDEELPS
jgi:hypothetical protein